MALIANLQYAWTLFVDPMHVARGWSLAEIQWAFSIFIATETWLTPAAARSSTGWGRGGDQPDDRLWRAAGGDRLGGQRLRRFADAAVRGRGDFRHRRRAIYATCVGNAVKWFPDRRGLVSG